MEGLILGIDIGTSSVKAVLVNRTDSEVIEEHSEPTNANITSPVDGGDEQDVRKIFETLEKVIKQITPSKLKDIKCIGVCGQMHGVVLWKDVQLSDKGHIVINDATSLVTWQDKRTTDRPLPLGYGCSTLYWYSINQPHLLTQYNRAGTVMDLLVYVLCGVESVTMATHNAYSWGCFNTTTLEWDTNR